MAKRKKSYTVRWVVATEPKSRTFATRALADNLRSDLMQAINRGEAFDLDSGLPDSMVVAKDAVTVLAFAQKYVDMKWPGAAAKSRDGMTDALATLVTSRPSAGKRFTDSGEVHDDRGLTHRGDDEARTVPIPPELVALLRWHIDTFGVGPDGAALRRRRGWRCNP